MSYQNELQFFQEHAVCLLPRDIVLLDKSGTVVLFLVHDAAKRFPEEMFLKENDSYYSPTLTSYYASLTNAAEDALKYKSKHASRTSDRVAGSTEEFKKLFHPGNTCVQPALTPPAHFAIWEPVLRKDFGILVLMLCG
ncbi:hypothetical protein HK405_001281 [Cladochytrium tenue]|nr:hypothetical protein HK405_001281 [Cladochytrium tenue]